MRNRTLQYNLTTGRFTLPVVIFACTFCWILSYVLVPNLDVSVQRSPHDFFLWRELVSYLPVWGERLLNYLIYAIIGYFLIEMNNRFAIIRMRASIQTVVYFLIITICPEMHLLYAGDMAAVAFLAAMYFLFCSYQQTHPATYLFYSFMAIGIGSLFLPQLTYLAPIWLFEAYRFQSLTLRSFCAAVVGWALPYWFLFAHAAFYGDMELFYRPFRELLIFGQPFNLALLQPWQWGVLGYLLLLATISTIHCIASGLDDKIRTRSYLRFLIDQTFCLFLAIAVLPMYCMDFMPQLLISSSVLIGHFFVLTNSKASNGLFIFSLAALLLLFAFNIWTLL
ncbi:MAG: hypothetical protein LBN24_09695 [Mediterranea sp.]|jgi:hypothetical protein|nr:hypothetical protein [Mediterranea sp.]